jgi:hypothetical protein
LAGGLDGGTGFTARRARAVKEIEMVGRANVIAIVLATLVAGCAGKGTGLAVAPLPNEQAELTAYAAGARFPEGTQASDDVKVTAVVDRSERTIAIRNFGDDELKDLEVWVDGKYVRRLPALAARAGVVLHFGQFYDAAGETLAAGNGTVARVQLKVGDRLLNAMGPAFD